MKKLLLLTDLSDQSVNTYRYGLQLAKALKAEIVLLYCSSEKALTMTEQFSYLQKLRSFADRFANEPTTKAAKQPPVECFVTAGAPVNAIANMAETRQIDLLLTGENFLENLQTETPLPLQQLIPCPAILVPEGVQFKKIKEVVFATDFTNQDVEVAKGICNLADALKAHVSFLHFYPKKERNRRAQILHKGEELAAQLSCQTSLHLIEEEDLLEGMNDFAEKHRADLFVLATQDTHLLQLYFQQTYHKTQAYHTRVPLLNLYQERHAPCSASCTFCHSEHEHEQHAEKAVH
ncbi:universal stress protein [Adhaeribacter terreus]|uniref:Universal stress protein n=1 Tax=Adhaeribacter terreus TaxID=529703 RepID=A0ABW0EHE8_9BACT